MKTMVLFLCSWIVGLFLAQIIFFGLSASIGYSLVFGWWFVAYFTKNDIPTYKQVATIFCALLIILFGVYISGYYDYLYRDAPSQISPALLLLILLQAVFFITPILFNKLVLWTQAYIARRGA